MCLVSKELVVDVLNPIGIVNFGNKYMNCPFCKIETPLLENNLSFVIYDKFPVSNGHCLIIPKRHHKNYFNSTKEENDSYFDLIKKTKQLLDDLYSPDGYNIGINTEECSGQTVFHTHIHIIPRYKGDIDNPRGGVRGVIPNKKDY